MRDSAFMAGESFARLRRRIAEIEGRPAGLEGPLPTVPEGERGAPVTFGVPEIDRRLGGGLRRDALHEVRSATTRAAGAATGFAAAILARLGLADDRPVLWVTEEAAAREGGLPYGPGLDRFGLLSCRLVTVVTRRPEEALWAFEEGLRCAGLAAVLAELRGRPRALDLTASRRLALSAREGGVTGLLLRQAVAAEPGAAATRWRVEPQPAGILGGFAAGIGRPAWRLDLERNRAGPTGRFDLEWDHVACRFAPGGRSVPALPLPGASPAVDRPHPADAVGAAAGFRRAG